MSNIHWYDIIMKSNINPLPYVTSASSAYSVSHDAFAAFNDVLDNPIVTNCWASARYQSVNSWIKIDFGSPRKISNVLLTPRASEFVSQTPSSIKVEGSNDDENWTELGTFNNIVWQPLTSQTFEFEGGFYRYTKLTNLAFSKSTEYAGWSNIKYGAADRTLIKSNDEIYYYNKANSIWEKLGVAELTDTLFETYGKLTLSNDMISNAPNPFSVLTVTYSDKNKKHTLNGTKIKPYQLTSLQNPIGIKWASNLKRINVTSSINNGIKCVISFDNTSWYGQGLSSLSNLDREIVASDGMILDELISYSSTNLEPIRNKSGHLYLAFYFPDEASIIDSIEIIGDEWGKYKQEQMTSNSYEVSYLNPTTLEVKLFKNYDAIKINY